MLELKIRTKFIRLMSSTHFLYIRANGNTLTLQFAIVVHGLTLVCAPCVKHLTRFSLLVPSKAQITIFFLLNCLQLDKNFKWKERLVEHMYRLVSLQSSLQRDRQASLLYELSHYYCLVCFSVVASCTSAIFA